VLQMRWRSEAAPTAVVQKLRLTIHQDGSEFYNNANEDEQFYHNTAEPEGAQLYNNSENDSTKDTYYN
jgi:hypothetical protein